MPNGSLAMEMVRLSGGTFARVDDAGEHASEVEVSDFSMGRYAVTFEQYDRFAEATDRKLPGACGWGRRSRPIMKVSWFDATAYAQWLSDVTGEISVFQLKPNGSMHAGQEPIQTILLAKTLPTNRLISIEQTVKQCL